MKYLALMIAFVFITIGSASYTNAQDVVDKTKDATQKAAKVTAEAAKKTTVVVTDTLAEAANKTASATADAAKTTTTKAQSFGRSTVNVTENIVGQTYEGGKYLTVTAWDGTKWASKRVWYPNRSTPNKP